MSVSAPQAYQLTTDAYRRMFETGLFNDKHVELIEGTLVEYGRKEPPYCTAVTLVGNELREKVSRSCGCFVAEHFPLKLSELSLAQPDVALIAGAPRDYADREPTTAKLIVEVADDSLVFDRNEKASFYAKAGIVDYWIVNLQDRQVEVYRRPMVDDNARFGFNYADKMIFKEGDLVRPLAKPKASIAVVDLLP